MGDPGSIPGLGRSPGEGKGYPLQYSGLENSMGYIVGSQVVKEAARNLTNRASRIHQHLSNSWENWLSKESDTTERLPLSSFTTFDVLA